MLEPADRAGAGAAQYDAGFPRGTQMAVEFPLAPHREHAARVAAADEYRVLLEHERSEVARRAREQRQMRRPAGELPEPGVEAQAPRVVIAVRGTNERDLGLALAGLLEEVIDEQQVVEFDWQRRAADSNDLPFLHT